MPSHLYKQHLETGDWHRSDLATGSAFGPAAKFSRVDAEGEDGDAVLFRRRPKAPASAADEPVDLPVAIEMSFPAPPVRVPRGLEDRLRAALRATGAEYAVALDNGLLPFAQQKGEGRRLAGGSTYWSVNRVLRERAPTYPRLSTAEGRTSWAHNPSGSGVVVCDDVFVWDPEPGPPPSEWRAYAPDYLDLDFEPDGLPVVFSMVDIGPWGGVLVIMRLVEELCALGVNAQVLHSVNHQHSLKMPYSPKKMFSSQWKDYPLENGVWISTNWWSRTFALTGKPGVIPLVYLQDNEALFRDTKGRKNLTQAVTDRYLEVGNRVANSGWVVDSCVEHHGLAKEDFTVIPVGIDTELFVPGEKSAEGAPIRICAMWRPVTPRRGSARLEQLYRDLKAKYGTRLSLEVFGETKPAPAVVDVHHGWCTQKEVAQIMSGIDVFAEPSDYQGFGLPLAEAMACGCAGVSTQCGGINTYATHEQDALIVPHDDLLEGVSRVIDDAELRKRLQAAGPEAIAKIAWPEIGRQWKAYLENLVRENGQELTLG